MGYEGIAAINPKAVVLSSSFQGQDGPDAAQPGYASLLHALCGINRINGWPDLPPTDIADAYGDLIGVWYGLGGAAWRRSTAAASRAAGRTSTCRSSTRRSTSSPPLSWTYLGERPKRGFPEGNRSPEAAQHGVYPCAADPAAAPEADDRWCAIAVHTPTSSGSALVEVMGRPDLGRRRPIRDRGGPPGERRQRSTR